MRTYRQYSLVPRLSLLVIILTIELTRNKNFSFVRVQGQRSCNVSIRKGGEPGDEATDSTW